MKNFRDYETLIRDCVKKINDEDPHWNFSVKSLAKDRVRIRWTYLDYCEEKDNCFFLTILPPIDKDDNELFITCRTPQDDMINGYVCDLNSNLHIDDPESAIRSCINSIAYYAHSRY